MITIISCTNREEANSLRIARLYEKLLVDEGADARILDLRSLPPDFIFSAMFGKAGENEGLNVITDELAASDKLVFIVPEYNGSFPGILKAFLDTLEFPNALKNKTAALVGLSSGTQGGALAMSHLTDVLHYFGMFVLPIKPRLARIHHYIHEGELTENLYLSLLKEQVTQLLAK